MTSVILLLIIIARLYGWTIETTNNYVKSKVSRSNQRLVHTGGKIVESREKTFKAEKKSKKLSSLVMYGNERKQTFIKIGLGHMAAPTVTWLN